MSGPGRSSFGQPPRGSVPPPSPDVCHGIVFTEVLEWFDDAGSEVAHRLPERGSGEFKMGGQVIVRDSQAAVFSAGGPWATSRCPRIGVAKRRPCWCPPSRCNLDRSFVRVARNLSLFPLPPPPDPRLAEDSDRVEPARLPLTEAAQALKVVLAEMVRGQTTKLALLPGARLRVRRARLLLLPFRLQGGESVEATSGTVLSVGAVARGRGI